MADTDHNQRAPGWSARVRSAVASLSREQVFRAAAEIAVVTVGLTAAGGAGWAVVAARQTMHGRMATYAQYTPRASMVHVGFIEIAENTP